MVELEGICCRHAILDASYGPNGHFLFGIMPTSALFKAIIYVPSLFPVGAPFKKFESSRDDWAINNRYISPGKLCL